MYATDFPNLFGRSRYYPIKISKLSIYTLGRFPKISDTVNIAGRESKPRSTTKTPFQKILQTGVDKTGVLRYNDSNKQTTGDSHDYSNN